MLGFSGKDRFSGLSPLKPLGNIRLGKREDKSDSFSPSVAFHEEEDRFLVCEELAGCDRLGEAFELPTEVRLIGGGERL